MMPHLDRESNSLASNGLYPHNLTIRKTRTGVLPHPSKAKTFTRDKFLFHCAGTKILRSRDYRSIAIGNAGITRNTRERYGLLPHSPIIAEPQVLWVFFSRPTTAIKNVYFGEVTFVEVGLIGNGERERAKD